MDESIFHSLVYCLGLSPREKHLIIQQELSEKRFSFLCRDRLFKIIGREFSGEWTPEQYLQRYKNELPYWKKQGIRWIRIDQVEYPPLLREIYDPPIILYYRGNLSSFRFPGIGVVGTRKPTETSRRAAYDFGRECAELGLPVVSGLALGIDCAVHGGCVQNRGLGSVVLGSGVLQVYPKSNRPLAAALVRMGGSLLSEYSPLEIPSPYRFVQRNRIISGLTRGLVVIDAPPGSGALHTLDFAIEQNREVAIHISGLQRDTGGGGLELYTLAGAPVVESALEVLKAWF